MNQHYCALKQTYTNHNVSWSLLFPGSLKQDILDYSRLTVEVVVE